MDSIIRLALSVILFWASSAYALDIPPAPTTYVSDFARILDPRQREEIEGNLAAFEKETSNQIVVAIFNSLDGEPLEDFTLRLATAWKIGQKNKDNGVLLAVFMKDRKSRIEVGYGLEGALPDGLCGRILRNELTPHFKAVAYGEGIRATVLAVQKATRGEYKAEERTSKINLDGPTLFFGGLILLVMIWCYCLYPLPVYVLGSVGYFALLNALHYPLIMALALIPFILLIEWIRQKWIVPRIGMTLRSSRRRGYSGWYLNDFGGGGGGGFGGGFSGGGGSFGGGGASGSW